MSTLIVSFGHSVREAPLFEGDYVRTEVITFTSSSQETSGEAIGKENCVNLLSDADAWVQINSDPDADEPGTGGADVWPIQANVAVQFQIEKGHRVSVIAR